MRKRTRRAAFGAVAIAAMAWASGVTARAATPHAAANAEVIHSQVSDDPGVLAGEGYVMPDPTHPGTITVVWLATSNWQAGAANLAKGYCGLATTTDGGRSWDWKQHLPQAEVLAGGHNVSIQSDMKTTITCGDPVGGIGPDGTVYAGAAAVGSPSWEQVSISHNHGATWSDPIEMFGANQSFNSITTADNAGKAKTPPAFFGRAYVAVDPVTGAVSAQTQEDGGAEGRWLVVSHDRGLTWSPPRPLDPDVQGKSAGPHSAANGVVALAYTVDPTSATYAAAVPTPAVSCSKACIVFETTKDDGVNWDRHVVTGADGAAGTKFVAADPARLGHYALLLSTVSSHTLEVWTTTDSGRSWIRHDVVDATQGDTFTKPGLGYAPHGGALGLVWRTQHTDGRYSVSALVSKTNAASWSGVVDLSGGPTPVSKASVPLSGDDCSCNIGMTDTTMSSVWGQWNADGSIIRELWFGSFDYTKL